MEFKPISHNYNFIMQAESEVSIKCFYWRYIVVLRNILFWNKEVLSVPLFGMVMGTSRTDPRLVIHESESFDERTEPNELIRKCLWYRHHWL